MLKEQFNYMNMEEAKPFQADQRDIRDSISAMLCVDEDKKSLY